MTTKYTLSDRIEYRLNGRLHRTDGPAVIWADGSQAWYYNGHRHRCDGPAIEYDNGIKYWYIIGVDLNEEIDIWFSETGFNRDYTTWTPEEKLLFKMRWC